MLENYVNGKYSQMVKAMAELNRKRHHPSLTRADTIQHLQTLDVVYTLDETHADIKDVIISHEPLVEKMFSELSTALKVVDFNIEDLDEMDEEMGIKLYTVVNVVSERYGITSPLLKCHAIIRCIYIEHYHSVCSERLGVLLKVFLETLFEENEFDNLDTDTLPINRIIEIGYVFLTHTSNFLFIF